MPDVDKPKLGTFLPVIACVIDGNVQGYILTALCSRLQRGRLQGGRILSRNENFNGGKV